MKAVLIAILAAMTLARASADEPAPAALDKKEQGRINREKFVKATGGFIIDKRNASGHSSIINSQTRLKTTFLKSKAESLEKNVWFQVQYFEPHKSFSLESINEIARESGGKTCVVLAEAEKLPSLTVLPESRCAIVNIAELANGCKDEAALEQRASKEITRAFCFAFGSGYSSRPGGLMDPVLSASELDKIPVDVIGLDVLPAVSRAAEQFGIGRFRRTTYLKACQEGWASAPTNDVQKAIWNKVHQVPDKPIKIEFDPKVDK